MYRLYVRVRQAVIFILNTYLGTQVIRLFLIFYWDEAEQEGRIRKVELNSLVFQDAYEEMRIHKFHIFMHLNIQVSFQVINIEVVQRHRFYQM